MSGLIARRRPTLSVEVRLPDINASGISWIRTETSTMFAAIGYDAANEVLRVIFRSGRQFEYCNFNSLRWYYFKRAKSLGRHWKAYLSTLNGTEVYFEGKHGPNE